jgi:hypothetical protein
VGDGTFQQVSTAVGGEPSVVADLNGDGIDDIVIGASVYAGNGDGTFQASPFYTAPLPDPSKIATAIAGDVNGDGRADLLVQYTTPTVSSGVAVFLGNGSGGFTADSNTYVTGNEVGASPYALPMAVLTRLNNQAAMLPGDKALDYLTFTSGGATVLLNQTNPAPKGPSLLPTTTTLAISAATANENQQVNLTATVMGVNPTGSVNFVAGSTTLGTATVTNGVATLPFQFTSAGSFSVTANYAGDTLNAGSMSNAVSIMIPAPDFSVAASPTTAAVAPGQSATTTLTLTPVAGYGGTVKFSCGTLPAGVTCSFAPSSLTPANGAAATTTLTVATTAPSTTMSSRIARAVGGIAWASLFVFALSPWRNGKANRKLAGWAMLALLMVCGSILLSGCGGGGGSSKGSGTTNPGTPAGVQSITVSAADSAGRPTHSLTFQLTVQ